MSRGGGREGGRGDNRTPPERTLPARATRQRPAWITAEERARFKALGPARFADPAYQRYVQSFRTPQSLSEAGKLGWAATAAKYDEDFAFDRAADKRRADLGRMSRDERTMFDLLTRELGERYTIDFNREVRVAPRTHVDFGWPVLRRAIEVHGGVHFGPLFNKDGIRERKDTEKKERIERAGWEVLIVTNDDLRRDALPDTREFARQFLERGRR